MVIKLCKVAAVLIALSKIPIEQVRFQNLGVLKKKKSGKRSHRFLCWTLIATLFGQLLFNYYLKFNFSQYYRNTVLRSKIYWLFLINWCAVWAYLLEIISSKLFLSRNIMDLNANFLKISSYFHSFFYDFLKKNFLFLLLEC